jgi:hypothetical protein
MLAEASINIIKTGYNISFTPNTASIIYEKYTKLGYKDLVLAYEE